MKQNLYLSPFRYAQIRAVERLVAEIKRRGGTVIVPPYAELSAIHISGVKDNEVELYPEFDTWHASWMGWSIYFESKNHSYHLWGDSNPSYPVYVLKSPLGDNTERCATVFKDFDFNYPEPRGYLNESPESDQSKRILDLLLLEPISEEFKD